MIQVRSIPIVFSLFFTVSAFAELKLVSPISVSRDIPQWNTQIEKEASDVRDSSSTGYTECAETSEIKSAYLCASYKQLDMNLAFLRASFFVEGVLGNPKGNVVKQSSADLKKMFYVAGGHDLTAKDLISFYKAMSKKCEEDNSYCPNEHEKEIFSQFILPTFKKNKNFVVITYAVSSRMTYEAVITHEIMHAYYFLQPEFRATVDQFWSEKVSDQEKMEIRERLSVIYDTSNEFLMKNEFQAYLLQAKSKNGELRDFVDMFRAPLMEAVHSIGVDPVQVQ